MLRGIALGACGVVGTAALFVHPHGAHLLLVVGLLAVAAAAASSVRFSAVAAAVVVSGSTDPWTSDPLVLPQRESVPQLILLSKPRR